MPHIDDEVLDRYSVGTLPPEVLAEVEEHLLFCQECQARLVQADEFAMLFRSAVQSGVQHRGWNWRRPWALPGKLLPAAAAAAALAVILAPWPLPTHAPAPPVIVMQSLRGPEAPARIHARHPAVLVFDVAAPEGPADYTVEIVDARGKRLLTAPAVASAGNLSFSLRTLARGSYWVRLYRKEGDAAPLAEYGLIAE
jgi:hypothetical protein